jgi:hypothetical protein
MIIVASPPIGMDRAARMPLLALAMPERPIHFAFVSGKDAENGAFKTERPGPRG